MTPATPGRIGFVGAGIIANRRPGDLFGFEDVSVTAIADLLGERAQEPAQLSWAKHTIASHGCWTRRGSTRFTSACRLSLTAARKRQPSSAAYPSLCRNHRLVTGTQQKRSPPVVVSRKLVTAVGYHWRYPRTTEEAQEFLARNPVRLALGYWLDSTPPPEWWIKEARSGGQMVEQTTHIFDLARLLVGGVESIYATGFRTDQPAFPESDVLDVSTARPVCSLGPGLHKMPCSGKPTRYAPLTMKHWKLAA
jgi:hypothetical protein